VDAIVAWSLYRAPDDGIVRQRPHLRADLGAEVLLQGARGGAGQLLAGDIHQGAHLHQQQRRLCTALQHVPQQLTGCVQEWCAGVQEWFGRQVGYTLIQSSRWSRLTSVELMG
jgi:hypothetical protein